MSAPVADQQNHFQPAKTHLHQQHQQNNQALQGDSKQETQTEDNSIKAEPVVVKEEYNQAEQAGPGTDVPSTSQLQSATQQLGRFPSSSCITEGCSCALAPTVVLQMQLVLVQDSSGRAQCLIGQRGDWADQTDVQRLGGIANAKKVHLLVHRRRPISEWRCEQAAKFCCAVHWPAQQ